MLRPLLQRPLSRLMRSPTQLSRLTWTPRLLFTAGQQGFWYDPADMSVQFQDSAGTTPVTAAGQPVGLVLDKSRGLAQGSEMRGTGVVGLLGAANAATYNAATGVGTATRVDASNQSYVRVPALAAGVLHRIIIVNTGAVLINVRVGNAASTVIGTAAAGATASFTYTPSSATDLFITSSTAGDIAFTLSAVFPIPGNHLVQSTTTSRWTLQQDSNGFLHWLLDGVDDGMATAAAVDFSGTDKVTVFAGVHKASDAGTGCIYETGAAPGTGTFALFSAANLYTSRTAGTGVVNDRSQTGYTAPISNVVTQSLDNSQATAALQNQPRVNGVAVGGSSSATTAANYASYLLYIGRRGGSSLPFNGRIYTLIARGAATDAATIARVERFVGARMGVAL